MLRKSVYKIIGSSLNDARTNINRLLASKTPCEEKAAAGKISPCAEAKKKSNPAPPKKPCPEVAKKPCPESKKSPCADVKKSPCSDVRKSPCADVKKSPCSDYTDWKKAKFSPCSEVNLAKKPCPDVKNSPCSDSKKDPDNTDWIYGNDALKKQSPCGKTAETPKFSPCSEVGLAKKPCPDVKKSPCPDTKSSTKKSDTLCGHHKELVPPASVLVDLKCFDLKSDCSSFHLKTSGHDQ